MTRMAKGRTTHLTAEEIAVELLRQYDVNHGEPSIRGLAAALNVTPRAIYHYYDTRQDLVEATMTLVWQEVVADVLTEIADPVTDVGDPIEFFVTVGVATRRAFGRHKRLAMHLGMTVQPSSRVAGTMAIIGSAFEQLGIKGDAAGLAMYSFLTYVLGSILLEASRWSSENDGTISGPPDPDVSLRELRPEDAPAVDDDTVDAIDRVVASDRPDGSTNEDLFAAGLRQLIVGFAREARSSVT